MHPPMAKPTNTWVRPFEYARIHNLPAPTVYRLIREGRVPPDRFRKTTVTVERLEIDPTYILALKTRL